MTTLFNNVPRTTTVIINGKKKSIVIPPTPNHVRKRMIDHANEFRKDFNLKPINVKDHLRK